MSVDAIRDTYRPRGEAEWYPIEGPLFDAWAASNRAACDLIHRKIEPEVHDVSA